jgi:hypothetical protein
MTTKGTKRLAVQILLAVLTTAAITPGLMLAEENRATKDKTPPESAAATNPQPSAGETQIKALEEKITQQQAQINQLLGIVGQLKQRLDGVTQNSNPSLALLPNAGTVASTLPVIPRAKEPAAPSSAPVAQPPQGEAEEASPLQFHLGTAYITPVGFLDFTSVWRSHDGGSGIGTNFGSIPYGNTTFQGNLSEFRLSMQNSRIGFRVDAMVKGAHAIGYMESDFLGNNPGNVAVSSNSNTLRSRLYWVDVRKGRWEVLGGQTWSLITPGRTGISPLPGDLFFSQNIDVNYQLGLVWGRIPELRVVFHPSNKAAFAIALDSPEQYAGGSAGGGLVTFPTALAATYGSELNTGGNTLNVPNVAPDIIAKLALDPSKRFHFEVGGVERNFKVWNPANSTTYKAEGGGGFVNLNVELLKGFRVMTNNFWSDGGGRYIFGQAPDLIAHADGSISLIHADSTVTGFEFTHKNSLLYAYYGGLYVYRNTAIDTGSAVPNIGYGWSGAKAPSGQNRAVQEGTFGIAQTFWKDAKYGALTLMGQYSYLTRNPWFVAAGQPSNTSLNMVFLNLRYTLPGSAPTLGK